MCVFVCVWGERGLEYICILCKCFTIHHFMYKYVCMAEKYRERERLCLLYFSQLIM